MTENALSILSVIFSVQLQQTEISERKLFIFHLGVTTALLKSEVSGTEKNKDPRVLDLQGWD